MTKNISEKKLWFAVSELCKSEIAQKAGIKNIPALNECDNMLNLIFYCLQPLREKLNKPMVISSGYRCPELNKLTGGVANSQHIKGQAADFTVPGMSISRTIEFIKNSGTEFDQMINEYDRWVHISYVHGKNRKQIIKKGA